MKPSRFLRQRATRALALLSLVAAAACAGDRDAATAPTAPVPAPRLEVVDPTVAATVLTREVPLAAPVSVSAVIGRKGGFLRLPEAGLLLIVPRGAVTEDVVFTATARAGDMVAYDFEPHMTFASPLVLIHDLKGTNFYKVAKTAKLEGAYVADMGTLNDVVDEATVNEFLPVVTDVQNSRMAFAVHHFSGYVIVTGRK